MNENSVIMESERLKFRPFVSADLAKLIELRSDEEVIKHIGGKTLQSPQALKERLKFYVDCYEKHGFANCAMIWKETDEMIGWGGLQPLEETAEIELAYGMIKNFWRRGIGFESGFSWLKYGFQSLDLKRIVALAVPENKGSWRIMEKLGMKHEKTSQHYGLECKFYGISRTEFESYHQL